MPRMWERHTMSDTVNADTKSKSKRNYNRKADNKINLKKVTDLLAGRPLKVTEAAKVLDCHPQSIYKAMTRSEIVIADYDLEKIKNNEVDELTIITHHARQHLYKLLLAGKLRGIETTAILDRCFQQRRELQGLGQSGITIFATILKQADAKILTVSTIPSTPVSDNQPIVPIESKDTIHCVPNAT